MHLLPFSLQNTNDHPSNESLDSALLSFLPVHFHYLDAPLSGVYCQFAVAAPSLMWLVPAPALRHALVVFSLSLCLLTLSLSSHYLFVFSRSPRPASSPSLETSPISVKYPPHSASQNPPPNATLKVNLCQRIKQRSFWLFISW